MPALTGRWAVLALLFFARLALAVQFQAIPAIAPVLIRDAGLSYAQIGVLTGLFMVPGALLSLPSGLVGARVGDKAVLVGGLGLALVGALLFAQSRTFPAMFASWLLCGLGAVLLNVQTPKIITDWFAGDRLATALAIMAAHFGLGVGIATAALGGLAEATSWRVAIAATAGLTAIGLVLVLVLYHDPSSGPPGDAASDRRRWRLSGRESVLSGIAGLAQTGFGTGYVVFMSFAPLLLVERGLPLGEAGALVGLAAAVALGSVPLGGYLTDRTGRDNLFIAGGALGTAASCALFALGGPAVLAILLFGLLRGGCTGGIQSLPGQVLRVESRSAGFGLFYTVHYLGLASLPSLAGALRDHTGSAEAGVWLSGALWLSIPLSLGLFRVLQRRRAPGRPTTAAR